MSKRIRRHQKQCKRSFRIRRTVQSLIPVEEIWEDGIFRSGSFYSKCYRFVDVNFKVASDDYKEKFLNAYASNVIKSIDSDAFGQIGVFRHRPTKWDTLASTGMELRGDKNDELRMEFNQLIHGESGERVCYVEDKYMTVSIYKPNLAGAQEYFKRLDLELPKAFKKIGSACAAMSAEERLMLLHNFYRPGESNHFDFHVRKRKQRREDFRNYIAPDGIRKHDDHLEVGDRFVRVLFLKDIANYLDDDFMDRLVTRNADIMYSVNFLPCDRVEAIQEAELRHMAMLSNNYRYNQRQTANGDFSGMAPYHMQQQEQEAFKYLKALKDDDQREYQVELLLLIAAESLKELDRETESIKAFALSKSCQMAVKKYQQIKGMNAVLPVGCWETNCFRTMQSTSLMVLHPFKVPEILEQKGIYFGVNRISGTPLICNKENQINAGAVIIGKSGSGKSGMAKCNIAMTTMGTDDQILIFDPEGEYWPVVKAICGDDAEIIQLCAGGKDHLNPLYMVDGYGDGNSISAKSEFIMSLVNRMDDKKLSSHDKSVIDRCLTAVYEEGERTGKTPTLSTLREKLLEQPEQVAKDVALTLELFTSGSFDIYGHESNVDLSKRVIVFNTHGLGENLKAASLLVITDTILNRTTLNWRQGKRTHIFIDEFHTVFADEFSTAFFASVWMQFRKRNGFPTALTQNVSYLLRSPEARVMVSNSEIIVMLSQSEEDQAVLSEMLNLSPDQLSYIQDEEPGNGLLKYGKLLIPFSNQIPKHMKLYELITTRPGEGVFARGQV